MADRWQYDTTKKNEVCVPFVFSKLRDKTYLRFSFDPPSYYNNILYSCGPGSSFGIATDYGLDGPGSNPGGDEIFRPSRPDLGPTQPPVKWVPFLSPE